MMPFARPPCPSILAKKQTIWTQQYLARRQRSKNARFDWPRHQGQRINLLLADLLRGATDGHCSYCDGWPSKILAEEIDHFEPKETAPQLAYDWGNLYLGCRVCNLNKLTKNVNGVLRPDEPGYSFARYFMLNYLSGDIEPNPRASPADQQRAVETIACFGLNNHERPDARQREVSLGVRSGMFPYRYI